MRYRGIPVNRRYCKLCRCSNVEDEKHFLVQCPIYLLEFNLVQANYDINLSFLTDILLTIDYKLIFNYIIDISKIRERIISTSTSTWYDVPSN